MFTKKSNIVIIGAGKISYSLVSALTNSNYHVSNVVSKRIVSAKALAKKFNAPNYSNNLKDIATKSEIFFLSVPDGQIEVVAKEISKQKLDFKNSLFVHLSGSLNTKVLSCLKQKKASVASFHIMQTFPQKKVFKINGSFAAIESNNIRVEKFLFKLAKDFELKPFEISTEEKIGYHLAGVFASNFLSINLFNASQLYKNKNFFDVFHPIIYSTLQNIEKIGSAEALSGPIDRGDVKTIKNHLTFIKKKIKNNKADSLYYSYVLQSLVGLNLVKAKYGKLSKSHLEVKKYLLAELRKINK